MRLWGEVGVPLHLLGTASFRVGVAQHEAHRKEVDQVPSPLCGWDMKDYPRSVCLAIRTSL